MLPEKVIAIITDEPGWHGRQLKNAFAARGYTGIYMSASDCRLEVSGERAQIWMPEIGTELPAGVFVRGIPGGTLEQVVLRLNILHALEDLGVEVYNDGRAMERTVDKAYTSFLLKQSGIPTPDTWMCESPAQARSILIRELARGEPLVLKPLFGSQGEGIQLLEAPEDLPDEEEVRGVYYLQRFIDRPAKDWQDIRVFVINGRTVAAMRRFGDHWITNRAQGGHCETLVIDSRMCELAEQAVKIIDIPYAGVDLLVDANGAYMVSEVNSIPAWQGLQGASKVKLAELLVDDFLARVNDSKRMLVSTPS